MKKHFYHWSKSRIGILTVSVFVCSVVNAQSKHNDVSEDVITAGNVLKGIEIQRTKEWAITTLEDAVTNDSSAYAMNVLGIAHMSGIGVEKDMAKAMTLLTMAGNKGFADAYNNLGMIYKYARNGVTQDFTVAFDFFMRGANDGSVMCMYDAGYMLYKGLGCRQDYARAAELFKDAANCNHSPSLYMLGLCYRNGYGVERDLALADNCLHAAASLNFTPAMEELERPYPENHLDDDYMESSSFTYLPDSIPEIYTDMNDYSLANGSFRGFIIMYDWSGKHLLGEKPAFMTLENKDGRNFTGMLTLGNDSVPFKAELSDDGWLKFSQGSIKLNERYTIGKKVAYRIDEAALNVWKGKISGRLCLYSLKQKEPERPMYIELVECDSDNVSSSGVKEYITVSPNPFVYSIDLAFNLAADADAKVNIFDTFSKMVYSRSIGHLEAGCNKVTISPALTSGSYVLNVIAGKQVFSTVIVKK